MGKIWPGRDLHWNAAAKKVNAISGKSRGA